MSEKNDLLDFFQQATDAMGADYKRISRRSKKDPGTAGDEGEENWADLLREWLPDGPRAKWRIWAQASCPMAPGRKWRMCMGAPLVLLRRISSIILVRWNKLKILRRLELLSLR